MCIDVSMSVGSVIIHLSIGVIFVCLYMTMWLRGFFGDRVEFFIIIDSYIHDMLYVLLVEWQYTYACVVSYDTFRIMIVTCSSLSRPGGLEIVFAHFCEFSGASGVSSSGTFCILLARKFLLGSSRIVKYDFVPLTSYGSFFKSLWFLKCEKNFYFTLCISRIFILGITLGNYFALNSKIEERNTIIKFYFVISSILL